MKITNIIALLLSASTVSANQEQTQFVSQHGSPQENGTTQYNIDEFSSGSVGFKARDFKVQSKSYYVKPPRHNKSLAEIRAGLDHKVTAGPFSFLGKTQQAVQPVVKKAATESTKTIVKPIPAPVAAPVVAPVVPTPTITVVQHAPSPPPAPVTVVHVVHDAPAPIAVVHVKTVAPAPHVVHVKSATPTVSAPAAALKAAEEDSILHKWWTVYGKQINIFHRKTNLDSGMAVFAVATLIVGMTVFALLVASIIESIVTQKEKVESKQNHKAGIKKGKDLENSSVSYRQKKGKNMA